ncbi:hypothetical protein DN730_17360 [Marinomonas piezotolerans]|uniref:Cytochrome c domain-containing protein n=1 Tax=Marinomonas piezotolerans TaxID=2213058 RepID=A0A370U4X0_9GAMM|nr:c-type cytochrome [Marinomonas piezotolerans]RDL42830.1 hypothetical protein DN730_17360 [Marinomonas piezotolerans]
MKLISHFGYITQVVVLFALLLTPSMTVFADETTFQKVCSSCHSGGIKGWLSGAPNVKKGEEWTKYHQRHNKKEMMAIVMNGLNGHKIKGGCKSCSDDEIKGALKYIFSNTKVHNKELE